MAGSFSQGSTTRDTASRGAGGLGGGRDGAGSLSRSPELGGRRPGNARGAPLNANTRDHTAGFLKALKIGGPGGALAFGLAKMIQGFFEPNPDGTFGFTPPGTSKERLDRQISRSREREGDKQGNPLLDILLRGAPSSQGAKPQTQPAQQASPIPDDLLDLLGAPAAARARTKDDETMELIRQILGGG